MYTAVIMSKSRDSLRGDGTWSCVTGKTKREAVTKAIRLRDRLSQHGFAENRVHEGDYDILVGELTEEAVTPVRYELVKL